MYKGLSIGIGFFAAVTILLAAVSAVAGDGYGQAAIVAAIGLSFAWTSAYCWRRAPIPSPQTEMETQEKIKGRRAVGVLMAASFALLFYIFVVPNLVRKHVASDMVSESIKSYNLVKSAGNKTDTCAYSSIVAAAMVQAKDVDGYKKWKALQADDCQIEHSPDNK